MMHRATSLLALLATLVLSTPFSRAQIYPPGYIADNSDWWSMIRDDSPIEHLNPQTHAPAPSNFRISDITLSYGDLFGSVARKFGKAPFTIRGDAAFFRKQVCYSSTFTSTADTPQTYLIFETGEVDVAFYLFTDGRSWSGEDRCVQSPLVTPALKTGSGLHLGMSRSEVEKVLGKPTLSRPNQLLYWKQVPKKTSAANLTRYRKENPTVSDRDFHENYDYYTLSAEIEARFAKSRLIYLGVDKSETY